MFAIIDIETSGGRGLDKITEIAVIIHDGTKIIDEFSTLLNPERNIPYFITNLTGITNEMVENAPKFFQIAKKIVELTHDKIIVAHNAGFDYTFIKNEFKSLGYDFKREKICTVKLARKLIPGLKSYSLGEICRDLDINITNRHRALGDALATAKLFEYLLSVNDNKLNLFTDAKLQSLQDINPVLDRDKIKVLPEETGIYYFYNDVKELIYVGKSKNIYSRVISHFNNTRVKKGLLMRALIADIDFELTGSELVAFLKESDIIKSEKPLYNRTQRCTIFQFGIFSFFDKNGYHCLQIEKLTNQKNPVLVFDTLASARKSLSDLVNKHTLCMKLCGLYETKGACFNYSVRLCNGACIGFESPGIYNKRVDEMLSGFRFHEQNFFIIDTGRSKNERSVIKIENNAYKGFGYIDISENISLESLHESINSFPDNHDIQQIIRAYLKKNKVEKIIPFENNIMGI